MQKHEPFAAKKRTLQPMTNEFFSSDKRSNLAKDEYYYSTEGFLVFTEKYLLKRGYCCQNGCRHCPYGFDKSKGRIIKK